MSLGPVQQRLSGMTPDVFLPEISDKLTKQYEYFTPLFQFSGAPGSSSVIYNYKSTGKWAEQAVRIANPDMFGMTKDYQQVRGNEQILRGDVDTITLSGYHLDVRVDFKSYLHGLTNVGDAYVNACSSMLIPTMRRRVSYDIIKKATNLAYPNLVPYSYEGADYDTQANMNLADTGPSWHRTALCGVKKTSAQHYANARFNALFNGMNVANNGLSGAAIRDGSLLARTGGQNKTASANEHKIAPVSMGMKNGLATDHYVLFVDPRCVKNLMATTASSTIDRGVILPHQANMIDGSRYVGMFHGVHVYEVDELMECSFTSADGNTMVAWNLLCGAGALGYARYGEVKFGREVDEREYDQTTFWCAEIRGEKLMKYPVRQAGAATRVEQGVVHLFSAIDA